MVATVRALTGRAPKAVFGDSADPARPRVRSLAGGGGPGGPHPGAQPEVDRGHDPPRLQGGVRAGGHRRLPVRLRRHRPRGRGLDVRAGDRRLRRRPGGPQVPRGVQPVGPAVDGRAAARGGRAGPVGRLAPRRWTPCGPPCWKPRAGRSRGDGAGPRDRRWSRPAAAAVLGRRRARTRPSWPSSSPAVDRRVGGVLLRGEKGSAKSTLARGLAALLPGSRPLRRAAARGDRGPGGRAPSTWPPRSPAGSSASRPGCWPPPTGGCSTSTRSTCCPTTWSTCCSTWPPAGSTGSSGRGSPTSTPSRFLLIGSMNPEEGDLRPQLLDRFGLAVEVRAAADPAARAAAVRRRLAFDDDPAAVAAAVAAEEAEPGAAGWPAPVPASLPDELVEAVSSLCAVDGGRGAARRPDHLPGRGRPGGLGRPGRASTVDDVRRVAPLALAHRSRRDPLEPAGMDQAAAGGGLGRASGLDRRRRRRGRAGGGRGRPRRSGRPGGGRTAAVGAPEPVGAIAGAGGAGRDSGAGGRGPGPAGCGPGAAGRRRCRPGCGPTRLASPASGRGPGRRRVPAPAGQVGDRSPRASDRRPWRWRPPSVTLRPASLRTEACDRATRPVAPGDVREARRPGAHRQPDRAGR